MTDLFGNDGEYAGGGGDRLDGVRREFCGEAVEDGGVGVDHTAAGLPRGSGGEGGFVPVGVGGEDGGFGGGIDDDDVGLEGGMDISD